MCIHFNDFYRSGTTNVGGGINTVSVNTRIVEEYLDIPYYFYGTPYTKVKVRC